MPKSRGVPVRVGVNPRETPFSCDEDPARSRGRSGERSMAEALKIRVEPCDPAKNKGTGSRVSRRLRTEGRIPAVIYGHKQAVVPITLSRDDVWRMIKAASHLANLDLGNSTETVLIRDVQWDHMGKEI